MKQKDIALIIIIAAISGLASFFVSRMVFATPQNREQQVEVVDVITDQFNVPTDKKYFNDKSINPAQLIEVGDNDNPNPFKGDGQ
jgi:hypothetical protein